MFHFRVFLESTAHLNMTMSRPDGLPLHGENFDYALSDTPTFAGDTERVHVAFGDTERVHVAFGDTERVHVAFGDTERVHVAFGDTERVHVAFGDTERVHVAFRDTERVHVAFGDTERVHVAFRDTERVHVAFATFDNADRDIALDPLSTNRRLHTYIPVLGTVIVAGHTNDTIQVLVPDLPSHQWGTVHRWIYVMLWSCG